MSDNDVWVENSIAIEFPNSQSLDFTFRVRGCSAEQLLEAEARLRMHALCRKSEHGILGEQETTFDFLQNDTFIFVGAVSVAQLLVAADHLRHTREQRDD